jgi:hypothetical protein
VTNQQPTPTAEWTIESIVSVVLVPLIAASFLLVGVYCWKRFSLLRKDIQEHGDSMYGSKSFDCNTFGVVAGVCFGAVVVCALGLWWGMYPWKAEYHQWRPVSGVVETVDSRILPAGESSMEQKFVVRFKGNLQQYGVLDTRAAGVKPGDVLSVACVRRWQWSGAHGFDCNFVSLDGAR